MAGKAFRNFVVANLCLVLPALWLAMAWRPDQVLVRMRGREEAPGSLVGNGSALVGSKCGEWRGGRVFRFYLPKEMEWNRIAFRFPGASGAGAVERVELRKWNLLSLRRAGSGLVERESGTGEWIFPDSRFERIGFAGGKETWGLAAAELLLAVLSFASARKRRDGAWKDLFPTAAGVVPALMLLTQVVLPLQSYLTNRSTYPFPFAEVAGALAWRFAWMTALGIPAVAALARCFGRRVFGAVLALSACVYLEAVFLSNGLSELNGDIFLLMDLSRTLWDTAAWVAVFAAVLAAHPLLQKHYVRAALSVAAMAGASLLATLATGCKKPADRERLVFRDFVPLETVVRNVAYSTNRNVMVIILDSLEREQAHAIVEDPEAGPELRERFRGFTEYTNNVGALPQTLLAVPNLLTGRYPDGSDRMEDFFWSAYGPESVLVDFRETGHDLFVTTIGLGCGYASRTDRTAAGPAEKEPSVLMRPGGTGDAWSLRDFTRWRYAPFKAKATLTAVLEFIRPKEFREWIVYPELAKAGTSSSAGTFLLLHTPGVHVPIRWNRKGEMLTAADDSTRACVEQGVLLLEHLGKLMDAYRRAGIYDKSLILVMGDHGEHKEKNFRQDLKSDHLPRNARPFLWIKPAGAAGDFRSSGLPTGHAQVADLLRAAARRDLSAEDIDSMLQADKRIYRRMALLGAGWTDWVVDRNGAFEIEENATSLESCKDARPLKCGHRYVLNYRRQKQRFDADFKFRNVGTGGGLPFFPRNVKEWAVEFRVPDAGKRYVLRLEIHMSDGGSIRARCDGTDAEWEEFPVRPRGEIAVRGVQSSPSGMTRVVFERAAGPDVDVVFTSMTLTEEK